MSRLLPLLLATCVLICCLIGISTNGANQPVKNPTPSTAQGIVFHDANGNGVFDEGEEPLADIRVSNGREIVKTDAQGRYQLPLTDDTVLFVIKPRNWMTPVDENMLPQFYYVHKPYGSPKSKYAGVSPTGRLPDSVDFPLTPREEPDSFQAILFGDTQPRNQQEVDWMAHDVIAGMVGKHDAAFGVTLGDIVFDDLSIMEPMNRTIALLGIPWYNVVGNHDINLDAPSRKHATETFQRVYGPPYYSFDYGPVHFLVLDDIEWLFDSGTGKGRYRGGFGPEQIEFIKRDLEMIPKDQMVVLMMHIPLDNVNDRHGLYRLIEQRPFCISISGHTHTHEHRWITHEDGWEGPEPHHHIVNVTVCGSWWSGAPDERGIPHATMSDGGPNGYSVISFDGTEYRLDYFAAGRPDDYQMEIDAPDMVASANAAESLVYVNVFNGSARSVVEMRVAGGEWRTMTQTREPDPKLKRTFEREATLLEAGAKWRKLPTPKPSTHLWKVNLPENLSVGTHLIEIRATDHWGRVFESTRVLRVE